MPIYIWKRLDANNGIPIPGLSNEDFAAVLEGYNYFNDDQDQHDFMFLRWFLQSNNFAQIREVW
jgi:hypothetical protein